MDAAKLAALIKEQAPAHAWHNENLPAEVVEDNGAVLIVQCSCNVRLTLKAGDVVAKFSVGPGGKVTDHLAPAAAKETKQKPAANKVVGDGS